MGDVLYVIREREILRRKNSREGNFSPFPLFSPPCIALGRAFARAAVVTATTSKSLRYPSSKIRKIIVWTAVIDTARVTDSRERPKVGNSRAFRKNAPNNIHWRGGLESAFECPRDWNYCDVYSINMARMESTSVYASLHVRRTSPAFLVFASRRRTGFLDNSPAILGGYLDEKID